MTRKDEAKILDQLEDACGRAEKARKDSYILLLLRAVYILWREKIREEDRGRTYNQTNNAEKG